MVKTLSNILLVSVAAIFMAACSATVEPVDSFDTVGVGNSTVERYIVVYDDAVGSKDDMRLQAASPEARIEAVTHLTNNLMIDIGARPIERRDAVGTIFRGAIVSLTKEQVARLSKHASVKYVELDRSIVGPFQPSVPAMAQHSNVTQILPWGVARIGGPVDASNSSVTVYIVDSGIDLDHPDLNVDVVRSRSFVEGNPSPDDGHGHGTHVAGIVGARDNQFGVVGVAPGVRLVSMRVLNERNWGQFSWSIQAFDAIASMARPGDVVNYSISPTARYTSEALDEAVRRLARRGIRVCLASGNAADDCREYSPARVNEPNIYTISAVGENGTLASFSNHGSTVDFAEPGTDIMSTAPGGTYVRMSGTSMATPHAAGLLVSGKIRAGHPVRADRDATREPLGIR